MKIQCDVCEKAPAVVICCADKAALCDECDMEVHAANKLAAKHPRLLLQNLSNKPPKCDICQDKAAIIFCVDDRALFCKDCEEPIHSASKLSGNHQRFLATGIRVALPSNCSNDTETNCAEPPEPKRNSQQIFMKTLSHQASSFASPWTVDEFLQISESDSSSKKEALELGELEWLADMGLFEEEISRQEVIVAAEVPQLGLSQTGYSTSYRRNPKSNMPFKKPRLEILDEDVEHFTVPDLG